MFRVSQQTRGALDSNRSCIPRRRGDHHRTTIIPVRAYYGLSDRPVIMDGIGVAAAGATACCQGTGLNRSTCCAARQAHMPATLSMNREIWSPLMEPALLVWQWRTPPLQKATS